MKSISFYALAAMAALCANALHAETESEYAAPHTVTAPAAAAPAAPRPAYSRPPTYAASAAKTAARLTVEQREERGFIKNAAATSRFEADASKLALTRSNDAGVRTFAANLVNHHHAASNELLHLLHVRGMAWPMLDNDQRKILNRLTKLSGTKFDREYMAIVGLKYQENDIRIYEKASLATKDPTLKAWIDKTLPMLRHHLMMAERAASLDVRTARAPRSAMAAAPRSTTAVMGAQRSGPAQPVSAQLSESSTR